MKFHVSTNRGERTTCTNSEDFPTVWLQRPHVSSSVCVSFVASLFPFSLISCYRFGYCQIFLHATGAICCQKMYGLSLLYSITRFCFFNRSLFTTNSHPVLGCHSALSGEKPSCQIKDQCAKLNQDTKDEAQSGGADGGRLGGEEGNQGSEFVTLCVLTSDGKDDFEGNSTLSWILGDPPEWEIDENVSFTGDRSITNIPSSVASATRTLTLYTNLSAPLILSCKLKLDVAMPFDIFSLDINGSRRKTYYVREEDWVLLTTGLQKGENTIEFKVTNTDKFVPMDRSAEAKYGTGSVWLDACTVVTQS